MGFFTALRSNGDVGIIHRFLEHVETSQRIALHTGRKYRKLGKFGAGALMPFLHGAEDAYTAHAREVVNNFYIRHALNSQFDTTLFRMLRSAQRAVDLPKWKRPAKTLTQ